MHFRQQRTTGLTSIASTPIPSCPCGCRIADLRLHEVISNRRFRSKTLTRIFTFSSIGVAALDQSRTTAASNGNTASAYLDNDIEFVTVRDALITTAFWVLAITKVTVPSTFPKFTVFALGRSIGVSAVPSLAKVACAKP